MDIELDAYTERTVILPAPPELVGRYFAQNEDLLSDLVGKEHVTALGAGRYRVATRGFSALGLTVTPAFEVEFVDHPGVTHMASQECRLLESNAMDVDLEASFEGEAQFHPAPEGTSLFCWTQAHARIKLPAFLRWMPRPVVQGALQALMKGAMEATSSRFVPLIQKDFERWRTHVPQSGLAL
ncbi:MAG TPA: DUF1997 domain-containing protein [Stenomitos sp.]